MVRIVSEVELSGRRWQKSLVIKDNCLRAWNWYAPDWRYIYISRQQTIRCYQAFKPSKLNSLKLNIFRDFSRKCLVAVGETVYLMRREPQWRNASGTCEMGKATWMSKENMQNKSFQHSSFLQSSKPVWFQRTWQKASFVKWSGQGNCVEVNSWTSQQDYSQCVLKSTLRRPVSMETQTGAWYCPQVKSPYDSSSWKEGIWVSFFFTV